MKQIQPFQKQWLQLTSIVVCRLNTIKISYRSYPCIGLPFRLVDDQVIFRSAYNSHCIKVNSVLGNYPDSKDHGANMGSIWVLSAPGGPHIGPMDLAIWVSTLRIVLYGPYIIWHLLPFFSFEIKHGVVGFLLNSHSTLQLWMSQCQGHCSIHNWQCWSELQHRTANNREQWVFLPCQSGVGGSGVLNFNAVGIEFL